MTKPLKTVDEHNAEVRAAREAAKHSGILCPACEDREMFWDHNPVGVFPPYRAVRCDCGHRRYVN